MVERDKILPKTLFPFIWHFLRNYKSVVIVYVALAVAAGFLGPFNSMLIKQVINLLPSIADGDTSILILPTSLIVVNFIVFNNFTWRGLTYIRAKFIPVIINRMIGELMEYVLGKSLQFYQDNLSGKISKQITNLADGIEKLASSVASNFLRGASKLLTRHHETLASLLKYRRGGEQRVHVEHVHVHDGGRAIVGNVGTGGGLNQKNEEGPHAKV